MTTVERLEELKTVDIKEIERDSLPKYKDLISDLFSQCQASFSDSRHIIFADKYMRWQIPFLINS